MAHFQNMDENMDIFIISGDLTLVKDLLEYDTLGNMMSNELNFDFLFLLKNKLKISVVLFTKQL